MIRNKFLGLNKGFWWKNPRGEEELNPLNLPNYQAGYLMNYTTDTPAGSINPSTISGEWFDAKILNNSAKRMSRGNATVTGTVNGFKCMYMGDSNGRLQNPTIDVGAGVTNFTLVIGFLKNGLVGSTQKMFAIQRAGGGIYPAMSYAVLNGTGRLSMVMTNDNFTNLVESQTALDYDDNQWHVLVASVDQTNKTVKILTDLESVITDTDPNYTTQSYTPDSQGDCIIGSWLVAPSEHFAPAYFGDIIILNQAVNEATMTQLLNWEKNRLGI